MAFTIVQHNIGAVNIYKGRAGKTIIGICDHIMQGTMAGTDSVFHNPDWQASAHYGVAKDGRIWQWVADEDTAWAEGIVNQPDLSIPWLATALKAGDNPNSYLISIEHEGKTGEPFTEVQYQATLWLHKLLIAKYKIIADRNHIIGHYQIDNVNRHMCPGVAFSWSKLMADLHPNLDSHYFPETGFTVNGDFLQFYNANGGVKIFGFPVSAEVQSSQYGLSYQGSVQWFQRCRMEWHDKEQAVMLGLVGSELLAKV